MGAASRQRIVDGYQWCHFRRRLQHAWAEAARLARGERDA
jgi:hypothetical protein